MTPPAGQRCEFRVYPESVHGRYFVVRVFGSVAAMKRFSRRHGHHCSGPCVAQVIPWRLSSADRRWRGGKFAGEVHFSLRFLRQRGMTAITHEATHAVLHFARVMGFAGAIAGTQPAVTAHNALYMARDSAEERFAYALGSRARQIVQHLYKTGVYV